MSIQLTPGVAPVAEPPATNTSTTAPRSPARYSGKTAPSTGRSSMRAGHHSCPGAGTTKRSTPSRSSGWEFCFSALSLAMSDSR